MKMKRAFISYLLAMVMLFSISFTASASEIVSDSDTPTFEVMENLIDPEFTELNNEPIETRQTSTSVIEGIDLSNVVEVFNQEDETKVLENELSTEPSSFASATRARMSRQVSTEEYVLSNYFLENIDSVDGMNSFNGSTTIKNNNTVMSRGIGNNSPDTAIFLDETYYDQPLNDYIIGNGVSNWYYVYASAASKINFYLSQAANQDCDVYLYKLDLSTGVLTMVDYSINEAQASDLIGYMADPGYYFIEVEPYGATNSNYYTFLTNVNNTFDQYEKNDSPNGSLTTFTGNMNINSNIDFMFDSDWYIFKPTSAGKYYVSLNNAPADAQYAFYFYNSNLGSLGSFLSSGNQSRWLDLEAYQNYYIRVESYDGNFAPQSPYNITVVKAPPAPPSITANSSNVFVGGRAINISWEYDFVSYGAYPNPGYYTRHEKTLLNMYGTSTIGNVYKGTFRGFNKTIQNALLIEVNYVSFYDYMMRHGNTTAPSYEPNRNLFHDTYEEYTTHGAFIYNIDTGKVEDNLGSYPYTWRGATYDFNATELIKRR